MTRPLYSIALHLYLFKIEIENQTFSILTGLLYQSGLSQPQLRSNVATSPGSSSHIMTASRGLGTASPGSSGSSGVGRTPLTRSSTSPRTPSLSASFGHSPSAPLMTSPKPDLSHLTDEERKIIEDVLNRQKSEETKEMEFLR